MNTFARDSKLCASFPTRLFLFSYCVLYNPIKDGTPISKKEKKTTNSDNDYDQPSVHLSDLDSPEASDNNMDDKDPFNSTDNFRSKATPTKSKNKPKFEPDLQNIPKSVKDLINLVKSSQMAKREVLPTNDFLTNWLELYNIQHLEKQSLIEKCDILSQNNRSLQNAVQLIHKEPNVLRKQGQITEPTSCLQRKQCRQ